MSGQNNSSKSEAYQQALTLLQQCVTTDGFLATPTENANYRRIWARDGVIIGLGALLTGESNLHDAFRNTLRTLVKYQGPHGEIPSNIDTVTERISYGGTTGRVDANLWFLIGCTEYWLACGDDDFIHELLPAMEKIRFLLGAWEFNNRGLIYIPQAGDWADEYLQSGYVLYDQLLYLQAQRSLYRVQTHIQGTDDHQFMERITHLKHLIQDNFWFDHRTADNIYHEVLYEKGLSAAQACVDKYWLPYFSPIGYGYGFDSFANILASLFGVSSGDQSNKVDEHIKSITPEQLNVIPAFDPVIYPEDRLWEDLQMTFSYSFKNKPHEYHNGGLWPMLNGFYIADLSKRGKHDIAQSYLDGLDTANAMDYQGLNWSFPEYIHGKKLVPGGTQQQGWSAAATIIAVKSLDGETVFRVDGYD